MKWLSRGFDQLRALAPVMIIIYGVTLAALLAAGVQKAVPSSFLMRDPAQVASFPFYIGLFSNISVLAWWSGAIVCLFSAALVGHRRVMAFLIYAGLLTALLGIDDLFLLHEDAFPEYVGLPDNVVLASYGVLTLLFLIVFRALILRTDYLLLLLAFGFTGCSVVIDAGVFDQGLNFLLDDGLKLLGIVSWSAYFIRTCAQVLRHERQGMLGARGGRTRATSRSLAHLRLMSSLPAMGGSRTVDDGRRVERMADGHTERAGRTGDGWRHGAGAGY